eukprot:TRINITY_DN21840_c0_g1_i1.p1 TRINITY_DN21840_c0_g1~~TRINITY_DN21840_c0_g1_i1.p1  ORF type:complete len:389 (+),score=82.36 TRINITY_DN21840_c0_g1_i1:129-1295(+)
MLSGLLGRTQKRQEPPREEASSNDKNELVSLAPRSQAAGSSAKVAAPLPKEVHSALLRALRAEGLEETAACLREEAGLEDLPSGQAGAGNEPAHQAVAASLLSSSSLPRDVKALLQSHGAGSSSAGGSSGRPASHHLADSHQHLAEQRKGLARLHAKIQELRADGAQWTGVAPTEGQDGDAAEAEEQALRAEIASLDAEVESLTKLLETRKEEEDKMRQRLKQTNDDIQVRRAMRTVKSSEPPIQAPGEQEVEKLRRILAQWSLSQSPPRMSAAAVFAKVDQNHDGRLEWNSDEIRMFVRKIFKNFEIRLPSWPDPLWYDLYRRCDVNGSYSLDLEESMKFAKTCFEMALYAQNPDQVLPSPRPPSARKSPGRDSNIGSIDEAEGQED